MSRITHGALHGIWILMVTALFQWGRSTAEADAGLAFLREEVRETRREASELREAVTQLAAETEDRFSELSLRVDRCEDPDNDLYRIHYLTVTAYTASPDETDASPEATALGLKPRPGLSVGVSRDLLHWLGKYVYVEGVGVRRVTDLMAARHRQSVDLLVPTKNEARRFGRKEDVRVVLLGDKP